MRYFALLLLLTLNSKSTIGQEITLTILDSLNRTPIENASIEIINRNVFYFSDQDGVVRIHDCVKGDTINIRRIGYLQQTILGSQIQNQSKPKIYLSPKIFSLSEVTVSATTNNGIFKDISELDIHLRPINNSQDILRMVPGLFIGQHAGGGKAEQIFLRGFDLDHGTDINISVDGLPVNMVSHAHGQGYADLHFVIPELIQNVNFNKGPYFAEKGNFTTAGFIEFRTKDYLKKNAEGDLMKKFKNARKFF